MLKLCFKAWRALIAFVRLAATSILVIHFAISGIVKLTNRVDSAIHDRFVYFYETKAVPQMHHNVGLDLSGSTFRVSLASLQLLVALLLLTPLKKKAASLGFLIMAALAQIMIWIEQDYTIEAVLSGLCALVALVDASPPSPRR